MDGHVDGALPGGEAQMLPSRPPGGSLLDAEIDFSATPGGRVVLRRTRLTGWTRAQGRGLANETRNPTR